MTLFDFDCLFWTRTCVYGFLLGYSIRFPILLGILYSFRVSSRLLTWLGRRFWSSGCAVMRLLMWGALLNSITLPGNCIILHIAITDVECWFRIFLLLLKWWSMFLLLTQACWTELFLLFSKYCKCYTHFPTCVDCFISINICHYVCTIGSCCFWINSRWLIRKTAHVEFCFQLGLLFQLLSFTCTAKSMRSKNVQNRILKKIFLLKFWKT